MSEELFRTLIRSIRFISPESPGARRVPSPEIPLLIFKDQSENWRHSRIDVLGVEFDYSESWYVEPDKIAGVPFTDSDTLRLKRHEWSVCKFSRTDALFWIRVEERLSSGGWENDRYFDNFSSRPRKIRGKGWTGRYSFVPCGYLHQNQEGSGEKRCRVAVLTSQSGIISIEEMLNSGVSEKAFRRFVSSFRIVPKLGPSHENNTP